MDFFTGKNRGEPFRRLSDGALLNCIRDGNEYATDYLMETYEPLIRPFAKLKLRTRLQAVGEAGDFAHDALLLLWTRAQTEGATVLNDENPSILNWLRQTITFRLCNAERKEQKHWRDDSQPDADGETDSILARLVDPTAHQFAEKPDRAVFEVVDEVLATYPEEDAPLFTLVYKRLMEGLSWKEVSAVMQQVYTNHRPPFEVIYLERTYWDRRHKNPFYHKLRVALTRYGYDY